MNEPRIKPTESMREHYGERMPLWLRLFIVISAGLALLGWVALCSAGEPQLGKGFSYWPRQQESLPIGDVIKLYESGFAGCWKDAKESRSLREWITANGGGIHGGEIARAYGFAGDGAGKLITPYLDLFALYPNCLPGGAQGRGDCVSWSTRNAILLTLACQAKAGRGPRPPPDLATGCPRVSAEAIASGVLSTEAIYWYRNHGGDGWSCDAAANVVLQKSGLWPRRNYSGLGVDLTQYSAGTAGKYGGHEPPEEYGAIGRRHLVRTATELQSAEEIRDFLNQGFGVSSCGGEGFSDERNEDGVSGRRGSWPHALAVIGFDDRPETVQKYSGPLLLIQNSWGSWNRGPRRIRGTEIDIPEGAFWARWSDVKNRYFIAFSGVNGWTIKQKSLGAKGVIWHGLNQRLRRAGGLADARRIPCLRAEYCCAA